MYIYFKSFDCTLVVPSFFPKPPNMKVNPPGYLVGSAAVLAAIACMTNAQAVDYTWHLTSGSANFTDSSRWDPTGVPAAGDNVYINDAGSSTSTVLINSGDTIAFKDMNFSQGFINMSGGTVTTTGRQHIYSSSGTGDTDYELQVSGGAVWTTTERFIIGEFSGTVDALVTGSGTTLTSNAYFVIGNGGGTGKLTVSNGASIQKLTTGDKLLVGDGGTGKLTVNDNSTVSSAAEINVGWNGGNGEVILNNTADFSTVSGGGKSIFLANSNGVNPTTGVVTLNDSATMKGDNEIWVGNGSGGTATLNVYDHATATGKANNFHIGRASSTGTVNVGGRTANDPNGYGALVANNNLMLSESSGGNATLNVNSHGTVQVTNAATIGNAGTATVNLSDSASMTAGSTVIGKGGANATVNLNGDSIFTVTGEASIGRDGGTGKVVINDTADMSASILTVGQYTNNGGRSGTLEMHGTGTGATLTVSNRLTIGHYYDTDGYLTTDGNSTINVITGGDFVVASAAARGTVSLGGNTVVNVANAFRVAKVTDGINGGQGTVTLSDNAQLSTTAGYISVAENGTGTLTMNGNSSLTAGSGYLYVGSAASSDDSKNAAVGTLTVDGGLVTATTALRMAEKSYGTALLNLNGGTVVAGQITEGAGNGTINFNGGTVKAAADQSDYFAGFENGDLNLQNDGLNFHTNGHNVAITQSFSGGGGVTKIGAGTLTLAASSGYSGGTVISAGTVQAGATYSLGDGNVLVSGGTLDLNDAASLELDLITGNLTLDGGALSLSLGDSIVSFGSFDLANGTVDLSGYTLGTYQILNFAGGGSVGSLTFTGLGDGLQGEINTSGQLVVAAVPEPSTVALLTICGGAALFVSMARRRRSTATV